jgi:hypothetical protein
MSCELLSDFRLVGGTSISLQTGHRRSDDIDLFTDADYGSVDLSSIIKWLKKNFNYVSNTGAVNNVPGISCFAGSSETDCIKLDLYYTETFIRPSLNSMQIRLATLEDIAAMKLDMTSQGGRKKDFWDIHELLDHFSLEELISFHIEKFPWTDPIPVIKGLTDFERADEMEDPVCLKGKIWELVKLDIEEIVEAHKK